MTLEGDVSETALLEPPDDRLQPWEPRGVRGGHRRQVPLGHPLGEVLRRDRAHEDEAAAAEHAESLLRCRVRPRELMEDEREQHPVERAVGEGQLLRVTDYPVDVRARRRRLPLRELEEPFGAVAPGYARGGGGRDRAGEATGPTADVEHLEARPDARGGDEQRNPEAHVVVGEARVEMLDGEPIRAERERVDHALVASRRERTKRRTVSRYRSGSSTNGRWPLSRKTTSSASGNCSLMKHEAPTGQIRSCSPARRSTGTRTPWSSRS